MDECIFCKIVKGEIPSTKLYEDDDVLAFLDINPANEGHSLIIPKKHHEKLNDIPVETLKKMIEVVQKVSKAIEKEMKPQGYNLLMSNGECAEQVIPHAHIHIIPRYNTDKFKFTWTHEVYGDGEADKIKEKITKSL